MVATKQALIREIKQLERAGEPLNHAAVNKSHNTLLAHATRQFGSWQAAIEAAGMDYSQISKIRRWPKDDVLQQLRRLHADGKIPDVSTLAADFPQLFSACRRHFGTGRLALAASTIGNYSTNTRGAGRRPSALPTFKRATRRASRCRAQ